MYPLTITTNVARKAIKYGEINSNPDSLTFREGTIRFSNLAHSVDIDVNADDTVKDIMDRLRVQAGDWLYVNYYDTHMGQLDARNASDFPLISISSVDGSAVNVLDIKGHIAEDALGLSTGIQGRLNPEGTDEGIMSLEWEVNEQRYDDDGSVDFPADILNITVAGHTHTLDLTTIRDVTNDETIKADDIAEFINSRMQDEDVRAFVNDDNELVLYSPRGYSIEMKFLDNANGDFFGFERANKNSSPNNKFSVDLSQTATPMRATDTFSENSTIRFISDSVNREVDIKAGDTVEDVIKKIKKVSFLDVEYSIDEDTGYPTISISSDEDGMPVSIIDMKGHVAEDVFGITTGFQSRLDGAVMDLEWDVENYSFPAEQVNIAVNGENHIIDLTKVGDFFEDTDITTDDVVDFINDKMEDYGVKAEINADKELVIYSPDGYGVKVSFLKNVNKNLLGSDQYVLDRTHYRGGYDLEDKAYYDGTDSPRGVDFDEGDLYDTGAHTQNATVRSGANTMRQNGFGTINDVMAAIESGNRDDLLEKMLPRVDDFINNILSVMAEDGALQARYNYNTERLVNENSVMTEEQDKLVKADPADVISQLMMADYMYQANLAVIARLIQPSLLDFLG